ncbi:MAG: N-formylglutamate deformylase [Gammaproteobacteria bacterium]|nr:N-formylglutamate deformylase [Gammaproteobacteria bacterium]
MNANFEFTKGSAPLLVSVPHDGRHIPSEIAERMTDTGRAIPDTDWHVARLYAFAADLGTSVIKANYSRYVVDLNRSASDEALYPGQLSTGLCPTASFSGEAIYLSGKEPNEREKNRRVDKYWRPYHEQIAATIAEIRSEFGYALLWDAHSIPGEVPLLFPGALPDLNIGTNGQRSCAGELQMSVSTVAQKSPYSSVLNGRFKGGHITRYYGKPENDVHAVQLELAQRCYMNESSRQFDESSAARLGETIASMIRAFLAAAQRVYS